MRAHRAPGSLSAAHHAVDRIAARASGEDPSLLRRCLAACGGGRLTATMACLITILMSSLLSASLRDWAVGLGLDGERGALIASLLIVMAATAATTVWRPHPGAARLGAIAALVAVEVVPFLARAASTGPTSGLIARPDVVGWVLQPLGMLLLGLIVASIGVGIGLVVRRDLAHLRSMLTARWLTGPALVAVAIAVAASSAALTALQVGPISALYRYDVVPASAVAGGLPGAASPKLSGAPAPFAPGHVEDITVAGRHALVHVPGVYSHPGGSFAVLYLLHGYPSNPAEAVSGLKLTNVVDQLVATHRLPATLIVVPDGNGTVTADAEWGNTANGNRIETWLIAQLVPAVDARYRTLGATFRGIAGYSSGGFGAINLSLRHPDVFRWAASWSGYFTGRRDIFGSQADANSPDRAVALLAPARRMALYLGAGDHDGSYLSQTQRFIAELRSLGWPMLHTDVVRGGHSPEAWRAQMVNSLTWLGTLWDSSPQRQPPSAVRAWP